MSSPCLIRDLSDTGARLEVSEDIPIPGQFDLYIEKMQQTLPAIVRRRRGREVGIAFRHATAAASQPNGSPAAPPEAALAERVTKLETELADIRRLLKKLALALRKNV